MQAPVLLADCESLSGEMLLAGPGRAANQLQACCYTDVGGAPEAWHRFTMNRRNPELTLIAVGTEICVSVCVSVSVSVCPKVRVGFCHRGALGQCRF